MDVLDEVFSVVRDRVRNPREDSYVSSLLSDPKGLDRVLEKIGEESFEVVIAAKNGRDGEIVAESADLIFHLMVMLAVKGISLDDVRAEFARRRK
ncbi:phosphoribosyl-ATP pyrophosphatase [Methanocella conradii HZ254]|uniref:Phosphoribosyl-ATP pyrophosphatase n=1 Tax=Methanocella conradii (strain DSM 24694 / JCM 17849 / CGMCC 1.5162 / HZ254) TaxID=1041930 RepID=H8I5Z5_METCZ|nr:phosphoribosyl-ATP diphosphatase [Methanocella conradii]AFD00229.1 phosphoribosyl-ATP pyrophosphatase [Methanocella conradii HZ254]